MSAPPSHEVEHRAAPRDIRASTRRVVVYRLGSLGDTVVALPCLHRIAKVYPHAHRIMLTNFPVSSKAAPLEAILGGSGLVHRYVAYPVGTRSVRALMNLRTTLRAFEADTLVYLTPSRGLLAAWRDWVYFKLCGFEHIIGAPLTPDLQRNRIDADGHVERECSRLARCVAPLGPISLSDPASWALNLSDAEREGAAQWLGDAAHAPRIAINMGGKVVQNDWGEANWLALIGRLRGRFADHALVFVGGSEDAARAARVGALWSGPVVNLCGVISPRVSAAAMTGARLFVGHDSGPMHLAASVGVSCVGLYGNKQPPCKWHPFGDGHHILHDHRGTTEIGVDEVEQVVVTMLGSPRAAPVPAGVKSGTAVGVDAGAVTGEVN